VALAIYFLLNLLGIAIGLSISDDVRPGTISTGAAIWSFVALVMALFFGGWVTTQCTTGENRTEAVLYGIIVWAVTSSLLVWLTAAGLNLGYRAVMAHPNARASSQSTNANGVSAAEVETAGRQAGLSPAEVRSMQDQLADDGAGGNDNRMEKLRDDAQTAAWWAFGGTLLSMLAAIGGALVGPYEVVLRRGYATATVVRSNRAGPVT